MDAVTDLVADPGFRAGLLYGLAAAVVVALAALAGRRVRPGAGVAFGVAAVLALDHQYTVGTRLVVGLAALVVAGAATAGGHPLVRLAAAVPGAVLVARSTGLDDPGWAQPVVVAATVVGGALVAECDRSLGRWGVPPVLVAATALGIYGTTPDTEHAMVLVGVALAVALLGWPWPLASLGPGGSFAVAAVVSWTVVVDGLARPGAVVGGLACLGLLVVEPAVRLVTGRRPAAGGGDAARADEAPPTRTGGPPLRDLAVLAALHLGLVAVCSRVAGLSTSAGRALAIGLVAHAVAGAALVAFHRRPRVERHDVAACHDRHDEHGPQPDPELRDRHGRQVG